MRALSWRADAEQAVQIPADLAAPREIGLGPMARVVRVLLAVLADLLRIVIDGKDRVGQALLGRAGQDRDLPRLCIRPRWSARGNRQDLFDRCPRDGRRQEGADRPARGDRMVDDAVRARRRAIGHRQILSSAARSGAGKRAGRRVARST
jgi:hypothetical protein